MGAFRLPDPTPLVCDTRRQIFDQPIPVDNKLAGVGLAETVRGQAQLRLVCCRGVRESLSNALLMPAAAPKGHPIQRLLDKTRLVWITECASAQLRLAGDGFIHRRRLATRARARRRMNSTSSTRNPAEAGWHRSPSALQRSFV